MTQGFFYNIPMKLNPNHPHNSYSFGFIKKFSSDQFDQCVYLGDTVTSKSGLVSDRAGGYKLANSAKPFLSFKANRYENKKDKKIRRIFFYF